VSLTITHTSADGTLLEGTRKGDGAWEAIKAAQASYKLRGWRYFPSIRAIGVSHSRDRAPQTHLIERTADVLREAGFDVTVSVDAAPRAMEEAEADRAERMESRAERLHHRAERLVGESDRRYDVATEIAERRPFGQPILVGHHSEHGARADQRRIESNMDKFCELAAESRQAEAAAKAAERHMAHRENPRVTARRIERLEADKRRAEKYLTGWSQNHLNGDGTRVLWTDTHPPAEGAYREQLLTQVDHLTEQLRYWRDQLEQAKAAGRYNPVELSEISKGDLIRTRFGWKRVVRVNKKTVSVETGYSWTDKYEVTDILEHQAAASV
jgi:hypothetical protein